MTRTKTRANANMPNNFVSTLDFGIPGDLTDDGQNHVRLLEAAKYAVATTSALRIEGRILVSDTVNFDTSTSDYDNLPGVSPFFLNGSGKSLSIIGDIGASGIYGNYASFANQGSTGNRKAVVTYRSQSQSRIEGIEFALRIDSQPDNSLFPAVENVELLYYQSTDRGIISGCRFTGIRGINNVTAIGAGIGIHMTDCMSCVIEKCDIQYFTYAGLFFDNGGRNGTSLRFSNNHVSVGKPGASSRDECAGVRMQGGHSSYFISNVYENYDVGRAMNLGSTDNYVSSSWFEGNYDTIYVNGLYQTIVGNFGIGYNPGLSYIEGVGSYVTPDGVVPPATITDTVKKSLNIIYSNFYQRGNNQLTELDINGSLDVSQAITGGYGGFISPTSNGIQGYVGSKKDLNDIPSQTRLWINSPVSHSVAGLMLSKDTSGQGNPPTLRASFIYNDSSATDGLQIQSYGDKRIVLYLNENVEYYLQKDALIPYGTSKSLGTNALKWSQVYSDVVKSHDIELRLDDPATSYRAVNGDDDVQEYTGQTLSLKQTILDLQARIAALESSS